MRILLNTLYVTTPEAYLSKDGLNVVVSVKQDEVFRIPVHNIEQIVTFGYMGGKSRTDEIVCGQWRRSYLSFSTGKVYKSFTRADKGKRVAS